MKPCLHLSGLIVTLLLAFPVRAAVCTGAPVVATPPVPAVAALRAYRHALASPVRLAVDAAGSVYIADPRKGEVLVRAEDGRVLQHRGGLGQPGAIAVDSANNVYLADLETGSIAVFDASWQFSHQFPGAALSQAGDMTIDDSRSRLIVSDSEAHRVRVYSLAGQALFEIGAQGDGDGQFQYPSGVFFDAVNDELLVSDQLGYRLQVFDADGAFKYCIGGSSASPGSFFQGGRLLAAPQGLWADPLGRIYVADSFEGTVKVIDRNGNLLTAIGAFGSAVGELRIPSDVVLDGSGRLFVTSANNARVEMFGIDGFADPEQYVPALVRIDPERVLAGSSGLLNVLFTVPGTRLADVQHDSIRLNGLLPLSLQTVDIDRDAEPEMLAGFDLADVLATLPAAGAAKVQLQAAAQAQLIDGSAAIEIIPTRLDQDQDGVDDLADACPDTAPGASVDLSGCSLAQLCPCADADRHGAHVKCVAKTSRRFVLDGLMDKRSRKQAVTAAARSDCGKGRGRAGDRNHHARKHAAGKRDSDDRRHADHSNSHRRDR